MSFRKKIAGLFCLFAWATAPLAWAGQYDIKEMTPAIQQALKNRQARFGELGRLKAAGDAGENNQGYVQGLGPSAASSTVLSEENADRRLIYQAIVSQNGLAPSAISQVQTVFAEVQRDKASPGESIQLPSGKWVKK